MDHSSHVRSAHIHSNAESQPDAMAQSSGGGGMSMPMYFVWGSNGPTLFSFFDLSSTRNYALFILLLMFFCLFREWLNVYRLGLESENREMQMLRSNARLPHALHINDGNLAISLETHRRCCGAVSAPFLSSLLYTINLMIAYFIMLVVMSYDAYMFIAVLLSSGLGHFYFQHHIPTQVVTKQRNALSPRLQQQQQQASPSTRRRHEESGEEFEHESLTPQADIRLQPTGGSPYATASKKQAALAIALSQDACCE